MNNIAIKKRLNAIDISHIFQIALASFGTQIIAHKIVQIYSIGYYAYIAFPVMCILACSVSYCVSIYGIHFIDNGINRKHIIRFCKLGELVLVGGSVMLLFIFVFGGCVSAVKYCFGDTKSHVSILVAIIFVDLFVVLIPLAGGYKRVFLRAIKEISNMKNHKGSLFTIEK